MGTEAKFVNCGACDRETNAKMGARRVTIGGRNVPLCDRCNEVSPEELAKAVLRRTATG